MALFMERGYAKTTVEEIAARAGLTERTFFRYFTDKREVLFSGAAELEAMVVDGIADALPGAPLAVVIGALEALGPQFEERRAFARLRATLLDENSELMERELIKLASLTARISAALEQRGVPAWTASLSAEAGVALFKVAFRRWVEDGDGAGLADHLRRALQELASASEAG